MGSSSGVAGADIGRALAYFQEHPDCLEPGARQIERKDTHISSVLISDRLVFKFKKPVDFPFLNQMSRSERLRNCEREIILNRRLAPDVYIGIRTITVADGVFGLSQGAREEGEPCVVMERLPENSNLLSHVVEGRADAVMLERIAARLADFHHGDSCGAAANGVRDFRGNYLQNLEVLSSIELFRDLDLDARLRHLLAVHSDQLAARECRGSIVDGHGDLRLDHIYVDQEAVRIIDCVEFSEAIRAVDPYEDLAFTSMALRFEGRADLARRLIAAYASATADVRGLAMLGLFEAYRAAVRAKIDVLTVRGRAPASKHYAGRIERYLRLCDAILKEQPMRPRALFVVSGLPATGKSTQALRLSRELDAPVISTDVVRKRYRDRKSEAGTFLYVPAAVAGTYRRVAALVGLCLRLGHKVIADGTYSSRQNRDRIRRTAARFGIAAQFIVTEASEEEVKARLERRRRKRSGDSDLTDMETWRALRKRWEPFAPDEPPPTVARGKE